MIRIRTVCRKHNCDIEPDSRVSLVRALYKLEPDASPFDANLAVQAGIWAEDGTVLKEGIWYLFDFSEFCCPNEEPIPDDTPADKEEELLCTSHWDVILEEVK